MRNVWKGMVVGALVGASLDAVLEAGRRGKTIGRKASERSKELVNDEWFLSAKGGPGPVSIPASALVGSTSLAFIGIPGMVDSGTGHVRHAVNLGFDALDLGPAVTERVGAVVHVENDVTAAALGAYHGLGLSSSILRPIQ